jgi:ATP-dependent Lhr-like helicase
LRSLGANELIRQEPNGEILLDLKGERIVNHHSFYAAFQTPEEYRLMSSGRALGTLPISYPLFPGLFLIFGGRRWAVVAVDEEKKVVDLKPAQGGRLPNFEGGRGAPVHDRVREEMLALYRSPDVPPFLDSGARDLLAEGREVFERFGLAEHRLINSGSGTLLFPWRGDRVLDTLVIWFSSLGHSVAKEGVALAFPNTAPDALRDQCTRLAASPPPHPEELAAVVVNKKIEKFHPWLSDHLLTLDYAGRALDVEGAWAVVRSLC